MFAPRQVISIESSVMQAMQLLIREVVDILWCSKMVVELFQPGVTDLIITSFKFILKRSYGN